VTPRRGLPTASFAVVLVILVACTIAGGCRKRSARETPQPDPQVVAMVGASEITIADYRSEVERRHASAQVAADPDILLQDMIDHQVLVQKARELGLDRDPEIRRTYENLLVGSLRARELEPELDAIDISDADIQHYYDAHRNDFLIPARIRIAVLVRKVNERNRDEIADQLNSVRREMPSLPADTVGFGVLAIGNSEDQISRYRGGDIGWLVVGQAHPRLPPDVLSAAAALSKPGDVSEIVDAESALYLIRLIDRKKTDVKPLPDVAQSIRKTLMRQQREAVENEFLQAMRQGVETDVNRQALTRAAAPYTKSAAETTREEPPALP
jgi:parvulin-like peptidyl-prolyl isomerase